jgi:hypothetical protein
LDVGFNCWFIGAWMGEYGKQVYDKVIERGGVVALEYNNYPLHGNCIGKKSALGEWMQGESAAQARYFNNTLDWTKRDQFCPSYVTGEGAAQFKEAVKTDIGRMLHGGTNSGFTGFPKSTLYWADWEREPWDANSMGYEVARTGDKSYCFCERCKKAFRAYAKLSATADLSDDAIFKNHKIDWSLFRTGMDGRIQKLVKEACNEVGILGRLQRQSGLGHSRLPG